MTLNERLMTRLTEELSGNPEAETLLTMVSMAIAFLTEDKLREMVTQLRNTFTEVLEG